MVSSPSRPNFLSHDTGYSGVLTTESDDAQSPPAKPHLTSYTSGYSGVATASNDGQSLLEKPHFATHVASHSGVSVIQGLPAADSPPARKRSPWKTLFVQILALLWLVPAIFLLFVNCKGWDIGPSAWCPPGDCFIDMLNPITAISEANMYRFDKRDHDLLGALQIGAKVLEVWFAGIAVNFVYTVTMRLANMRGGLPIQYLARPREFIDPLSSFQPSLWRALPALFGPRRQPARIWLWSFVFGTVLLCGLCNLMGPASAVLLLPSLGWQDIPAFGNYSFVRFNSEQPPGTYGWARVDSNCTIDTFGDQLYACTQRVWGQQLDNWVSAWLSSHQEAAGRSLGQHILQQGIVSFPGLSMPLDFAVTNTSITPDSSINKRLPNLYWVASRQAINSFTNDANYIREISLGKDASSLNMSQDMYESYLPYNNSLRLALHRNGPIYGASPNIWRSEDSVSHHRWTTYLDADRSINCWSNYTLHIVRTDEDNSFTKCIQSGAGWGANTKHASFSIPGRYDDQTHKIGAAVDVEVFSSAKAAFLPGGKLPSGISNACLGGGQDNFAPSTCDWDLFFDPDHSPETKHMSSFVNTVAMEKDNRSLVVDYVGVYDFTQYTYDPSPLTNPLLLVQTQDTPSTGTAIPIDPAWTLAAWSVANGSMFDSGRYLATLIHNKLDPGPARLKNLPYNDFASVIALAVVPIGHTLSYLDWDSNKGYTNPPTFSKDDNNHPLIQRTGKKYIWAYRLGSRTSYLGVAIVCCGIVVVLANFVLGLVDGRQHRTLTHLIIAALEHQPQQEFVGKSSSQMPQVRFQVTDSVHKAGKFDFYSR